MHVLIKYSFLTQYSLTHRQTLHVHGVIGPPCNFQLFKISELPHVIIRRNGVQFRFEQRLRRSLWQVTGGAVPKIERCFEILKRFVKVKVFFFVRKRSA